MSKQAIHTDQAPPAAGPYSQAIIANGFVFTAGQVGTIPGTRDLADGVQAQTRQALDYVGVVLRAAGTDFSRVVKTTVFLANMDDFAAMNEVYMTYFGDTPPARSTVQVARLPLGALVEIETVALAGES
jgi:2-iminobutanoate/2-iminopropanoate deaminase